MALKDQLITLGEKHPNLRPTLKVILDHLEQHPEDERDVGDWYEEQKGDSDLQDQGTSQQSLVEPSEESSSKENTLSGSPHTKQAFEAVILPQIESQIDNFNFDEIMGMMGEIESLGKSKNVDLENALIVYKPVSMNTRKFYQKIQEEFKNWIRPRLGGKDLPTHTPENSGSGDEKNYHFQFN